jgi:DNA repair protein RadC
MMSKVRSEEPPAYTPEDHSRAREDQIIAHAIDILDSRLRTQGEAFESPAAAGTYLKLRLAGYEREVFAAMFLDTRHRLIAFEELFMGTVDSAEVHPREVVKRALARNAAAVIVGHNHPSGNPEPSVGDRTVTIQLKQALALVDVRLLDHFVIGEGAPVSMAARGWV